jgi:predicted DNA-binding transcriptional regulator AlpA
LDSKAQVVLAKKAAALKAKGRKRGRPSKLAPLNQADIKKAGYAADGAQAQSDRQHAHGIRGPPAVRLLSKPEILQITGASFPAIWTWMRRGQFPRCYVMGHGGRSSRSVWRSDEIDAWIAGLALRPLKKIEEPDPA